MSMWLKQFREPKNIGQISNVYGEAGGACGDFIKIFLIADGSYIKKASFLATGCPAAIASATAVTQMVTGKTLLQAAKISGKDVQSWLQDLPDERLRCAQLAALALAKALESYCSFSSFSVRANPKRVLVGLSGGVDSSTTAYLLKEAGYEVVGATARVFDASCLNLPSLYKKEQLTDSLSRDDSKEKKVRERSCCQPQDIEDAQAVCQQLDIPHLVLDLRQQFKKAVIDRFCHLYLAGKTPNPCVDCNRYIRFQLFRQIALKLGSSAIATGHYVRLVKDGEKVSVYRAVDKSKDQSYLFWSATQEVLGNYLAPLGELTKNEVRSLAAQINLPVAEKQESQDICFIPENSYRDFLQSYYNLKPKTGVIVDTEGNILGQHQGFYHYTVGQRRGLNLSQPTPVYVLKLEPEQNRVVVGSREKLLQKQFEVTDFNFIAGKPPTEFKAQVMLRYNAPLYPAKVSLVSTNKAVVSLEHPAGPISPGQSAAFYDGEMLLGGGLIA